MVIAEEFPGGESDPIRAAVTYEGADLATDGIDADAQADLAVYLDDLQALDGVTAVESVLDPPPGLDGLAEELDLATDVVEVVLALDLVARELEQPRDGVAVRPVPR